MSKKISLNEILHSADSQTIDRIASQYKALDKQTSRRLYKKSVKRIAEKRNSGYTEVFTAESYKRRPIWNVAALTAVCAVIIGGVLIGLRNIKPPQPHIDHEPPVLYEKTTISDKVSTTSEDKPKVTSYTRDMTATSASETFATEAVTAEKTADSTSDVTGTSVTTAGKTQMTVKDEMNNTTVSSTAAPVSEIDIRLAELDAREAADPSVRYPRERQVILGNYTLTEPRPSYNEVKQFADEASSKEDFIKMVEEKYPYPDRVYGDGSVTEYWFIKNGMEKLVITRGEGISTEYVYGDPETVKCILPKDQATYAGQLRREERINTCAYIRERAILLGYITEDSPRLSMEWLKEMREECSSFSDFWHRLDAEQPYPDVRGDNASVTLIYYLNDEGSSYVTVIPDMGYAEYCDENNGDPIRAEIINDPEGVKSSDVVAVLKKMSDIEQKFR